MFFFEHQEEARRRTRLLVLLFLLAVAAIVLAVNGVMILIWQNTRDFHWFFRADGFPAYFFLTNTCVPLGLIGGGTLLELYRLRDGGDAVALMAGGRLMSPSTTDLQERRLQNVVEEMALAAGIACPNIYLLDREDSINAFAAGYHQNEAVIGVTRGTLERLNRDELQGVVAHEFSHILNGDMRLNMRLIAVLYGIQLLSGFGLRLLRLGQYVPRRSSDSRSNGNGQLFVLAAGLALYLIGYIGVFFGRIIKAAVSRQREFLADASAIQLTRNPDGIGGALRKIGGLSSKNGPGSRIEHPNAEHLSHLFLGAPMRSMIGGWFGTHPPIEERVRRIYGRSMPMLASESEQTASAEPANSLPSIDYGPVQLAAALATGQQAAPVLSVAPAAPASPLSVALERAVHEPAGACALVYALLMDRAGSKEQLALLQEEVPLQQAHVLALAEDIAALPGNARLPLLDLAMPALRCLAPEGRERLLALVSRLIAADKKMTLAEFVLHSLLARRLGPHAGRAVPVRFANIAALRLDCVALFSVVAHTEAVGSQLAADAAFLRGAARCPELHLSTADLLPWHQLPFTRVRLALSHADQLAPLAKPLLIKALVAICDENGAITGDVADLLRTICSAIDAPIPVAVARAYKAFEQTFATHP